MMSKLNMRLNLSGARSLGGSALAVMRRLEISIAGLDSICRGSCRPLLYMQVAGLLLILIIINLRLQFSWANRILCFALEDTGSIWIKSASDYNCPVSFFEVSFDLQNRQSWLPDCSSCYAAIFPTCCLGKSEC